MDHRSAEPELLADRELVAASLLPGFGTISAAGVLAAATPVGGESAVAAVSAVLIGFFEYRGQDWLLAGRQYAERPICVAKHWEFNEHFGLVIAP